MTTTTTYYAETRPDTYVSAETLAAIAGCVNRNWTNPEHIRIRAIGWLPPEVTQTDGMTQAKPRADRRYDEFPPLGSFPKYNATAFECSHTDGSRWLLWADDFGNVGEITGRALTLFASLYRFDPAAY